MKTKAKANHAEEDDHDENFSDLSQKITKMEKGRKALFDLGLTDQLASLDQQIAEAKNRIRMKKPIAAQISATRLLAARKVPLRARREVYKATVWATACFACEALCWSAADMKIIQVALNVTARSLSMPRCLVNAWD